MLDSRYQMGYPRARRDALTAAQLNRYRAMWEFSAGVAAPESGPTSLQIGLSNRCNLQCVYCAEQREGNTFPRLVLSKLARDRLSGVLESADTLGFFGISEFMIEPDFFETVAWCAQRGINLSITTNGTVCTPKHLDALGNFPGYIDIAFSVVAATADTYRYVRGWDFTRLLDNIRRYLDRFAAQPMRRFPAMSFVIMRSNMHEMVPFVHLAHSLGCRMVRFWRLVQIAENWNIPAPDGQPFDYQAEMYTLVPDAYNRALDDTRRAARELNMGLDLPGPI